MPSELLAVRAEGRLVWTVRSPVPVQGPGPPNNNKNNPPLRCLPAVLTDFGGIGREIYSAIIQPHFQQLYEAEVEEGKSGWAARRARRRWLHPAH